MTASRHIYWWPLTKVTAGATQNNLWGVTGTGGDSGELTIPSDVSTQWRSIWEVCDQLQTVIRAVHADYSAVTVTVEMDVTSAYFGHVKLVNTGKLIAPLPSDASTFLFDTLLGGDGTDPTPAETYYLPNAHASGCYISGSVVEDTGDNTVLVYDTATTLTGAKTGYKWGASYTRALRYEWLTETQKDALATLFEDSPDEIILISDTAATFADTADNYILESPDAFPFERGTTTDEWYHLSWVLGKK